MITRYVAREAWRCLCRGQAQDGQALILAAATLSLLIIPLGLAAWGVIQERADHATITALIRAATEDGAGSLALAPLPPTLGSGDVSCAPLPATGTAAGRTCRSFAAGLRQHYDGAYARVQVAEALVATHVQVLLGAPSAPVIDAVTGRAYHYPTVCLQATITIGIFAHDGLGFAQDFHACAQDVYRP